MKPWVVYSSGTSLALGASDEAVLPEDGGLRAFSEDLQLQCTALRPLAPSSCWRHLDAERQVGLCLPVHCRSLTLFINNKSAPEKDEFGSEFRVAPQNQEPDLKPSKQFWGRGI